MRPPTPSVPYDRLGTTGGPTGVSGTDGEGGLVAGGGANGTGGGTDDVAAPTPAAVDRRALVEDLRSLAALRSRTSVRDRPFPTLFALLPPDVVGDKERRLVALRTLVDQGIGRIDDDDHRKAAGPLFGFTDGRWRPLTERGQEAAAAFGCGWDNYRRRRTNGVSLLEETTDALARALEADRPAPAPAAPAPPVVLVGPAPDTGTDDTPPSRADPAALPTPRPRRRVLASVAGAVLVGLLAAVLVARVVDRSPDPVDCGLFAADLGDLPRNADADLRAWAPAFRGAADALGSGSTRCAAVMGHMHGVVTQRVAASSTEPASLLVAVGSDHRRVVALHHDELLEFRDLGQDERTGVVGLGRPVARDDQAGGIRLVRFTHGVVVTQPDGPSRSVYNQFWEAWTGAGGRTGRLGLPVSDRYLAADDGIYVQEFQGGEIRNGRDQPQPQATVVLGHDRTPALPDDYLNLVLRTGDDTAWLIGADGVRHWLPSDLDYACATAEQGASPSARISAAAIEALPRGKEYTCL